jgi:hypothetical protein
MHRRKRMRGSAGHTSLTGLRCYALTFRDAKVDSCVGNGDGADQPPFPLLISLQVQEDIMEDLRTIVSGVAGMTIKDRIRLCVVCQCPSSTLSLADNKGAWGGLLCSTPPLPQRSASLQVSADIRIRRACTSRLDHVPTRAVRPHDARGGMARHRTSSAIAGEGARASDSGGWYR